VKSVWSRRSGARSPAREKDFTFLQDFQTGPEAQPAFAAVGTGYIIEISQIIQTHNFCKLYKLFLELRMLYITYYATLM